MFFFNISLWFICYFKKGSVQKCEQVVLRYIQNGKLVFTDGVTKKVLTQLRRKEKGMLVHWWDTLEIVRQSKRKGWKSTLWVKKTFSSRSTRTIANTDCEQIIVKSFQKTFSHVWSKIVEHFLKTFWFSSHKSVAQNTQTWNRSLLCIVLSFFVFFAQFTHTMCRHQNSLNERGVLPHFRQMTNSVLYESNSFLASFANRLWQSG